MSTLTEAVALAHTDGERARVAVGIYVVPEPYDYFDPQSCDGDTGVKFKLEVNGLLVAKVSRSNHFDWSDEQIAGWLHEIADKRVQNWQRAIKRWVSLAPGDPS